MRFSDLRFLVAWLLPLLTINSVLNHPAYSALSTLVIWWGIALLDALWPGGKTSPAALAPGVGRIYFDWILRLYVPLQGVLIAVGAYAVVQADWLVVLGVAFSVGFITGSQGITFAHELGPPCVRLVVASIEPRTWGGDERWKWHDTDRHSKTER